MLFHTENKSATTSAGTFSVNVPTNQNMLKMIVISPTTGTTTYDFNIVDKFSKTVYSVTDITGLYNERDVNLPIYGNITFTVENSSVDESFDYLLVFKET